MLCDGDDRVNSKNDPSLGEIWWQRLRPWWRPMLDFLFPPTCLLCPAPPRDEDLAFCAECARQLQNAPGAHCLRCGAEVGPNLVTLSGCGYCRTEHYAFRRVIALGVYDGALQTAILSGQQVHGGPVMRGLTDLLVADRLTDFLGEEFDAIVPIPQDWGRRFFGIHSAAESVAERLAERLRRPLRTSILRKPRPTPSQTGAPPSVRREQQRGAFEVPPGLNLHGARLLLADDVLTTGATAEAAARALRSAGAAEIVVAVIARGLGASSLRPARREGSPADASSV